MRHALERFLAVLDQRDDEVLVDVLDWVRRLPAPASARAG